ncbi:MAG: hypothetical protein WD696_21525 [Bryobacteraceae bacterium]
MAERKRTAQPNPPAAIPVNGKETVTPNPRIPFRQPRAVSRKLREAAKNSLRENFKEFMEKAWSEEISFLSQVLEDWSGDCYGGQPRAADDHEIPICSAFEYNVSCDSLIQVDRDYVDEVNEFISQLEKFGRRKAYTGNSTEDDIKKRFLKALKAEIARFYDCAKLDEVRFLVRTLEAWASDPDDSHVAVVAAMERARAEGYKAANAA